MSLRPALVDPQGGPMTGNGGGPMSLAKPAVSWSHVAGKRQERPARRICNHQLPFCIPNNGFGTAAGRAC